MATFFGEILPVTSRAVDYDEEDDDDDVTSNPQSDPVIRWSKTFCAEVGDFASKKIPCAVLVIAVGTEANAFTEIYLKPYGYEAIGGVFTSPRDDDPVTLSHTSFAEKNCYIYRCRRNSQVILCQCKVDVLPEHSFAWTKLLIESFDLSATNIVVLASSGMSGYCSDVPFSELEPPFLRCLKTERFGGFPRCKILEQPNIVTGLPAQLMTFFQIRQYKAVLCVCFKEKRFMDIADVKVFTPLLQTKPLSDVTEVNKNADQMLRDIVKLHSVQDLMYM